MTSENLRTGERSTILPVPFVKPAADDAPAVPHPSDRGETAMNRLRHPFTPPHSR